MDIDIHDIVQILKIKFFYINTPFGGRWVEKPWKGQAYGNGRRTNNRGFNVDEMADKDFAKNFIKFYTGWKFLDAAEAEVLEDLRNKDNINLGMAGRCNRSVITSENQIQDNSKNINLTDIKNSDTKQEIKETATIVSSEKVNTTLSKK